MKPQYALIYPIEEPKIKHYGSKPLSRNWRVTLFQGKIHSPVQRLIY